MVIASKFGSANYWDFLLKSSKFNQPTVNVGDISNIRNLANQKKPHKNVRLFIR